MPVDILTKELTMRSLRYFLFNAFYSYIVERNETPMVLVDLSHPDVSVPPSARAGDVASVTLNLSMSASNNLTVEDTRVTANMRFNGHAARVEIPFEAMVVIFSRELKYNFPLQAIQDPMVDGESRPSAKQSVMERVRGVFSSDKPKAATQPPPSDPNAALFETRAPQQEPPASIAYNNVVDFASRFDKTRPKQ